MSTVKKTYPSEDIYSVTSNTATNKIEIIFEDVESAYYGSYSDWENERMLSDTTILNLEKDVAEALVDSLKEHLEENLNKDEKINLLEKGVYTGLSKTENSIKLEFDNKYLEMEIPVFNKILEDAYNQDLLKVCFNIELNSIGVKDDKK